MKIEYLQYFFTLAKSSSISKAAEELFISQQQLSRIITLLEDEIGAKLITRNTQGFSLTKDGKDFLKYTKNILSEYTAMKNHFYLRQNQHQYASIEKTECRVYLAPCFSLYASDIINGIRTIAPNIKLIVHDRTAKLNDGHFDKNAISFWAMEFTEEDLSIDGQLAFQVLEIATSTNYLAYNQQENQFDSMDENVGQFITACFSHALNYYKNESMFFVSGNIIQLIDSVSQNNAVCTLPAFTLPKIKPLYPDLGYIPVQNIILPISVVYPVNHTLTEADEIVINFMKTFIQSLHMLSKQII